MPGLISLLLRLALAVGSLLACAQAARATDFLEPEQAFRFVARPVDAGTIEIGFDIAPGYYMYREAIHITASGATLGAPELPQGKVKFDETFQKNVETYRGALRIRVPATGASKFRVDVMGQGCADKGLCYPPMPSAAEIELPANGSAGAARMLRVSDPFESAGTPTASAPSAIESALQSGRFWTVVGLFFAAGVLLSLTPCVLPMLPILSSIIAGDATASSSRSRGFMLALSYSLGMALVYTAFGVAAGLAGEGLAASLQTPWVLGVFASMLVAFSLSMLGAYELKAPAGMTNRLASTSQRLPAGRVAGVFAMGGVSALIVSPCVAAPLAGALLYLSQTRDVALGGTALFSLAAGMSLPLLLIGASAGAWLPRAGAWMNHVKHFFGVLLLAVAIWTIQPVLPAAAILLLWGALLLVCAGLLQPWRRGSGWIRRALAALLLIAGAAQLVGAATGAQDPLRPLSRYMQPCDAPAQAAVAFTAVRSVAELDAALRSAGRPVMLDFYADWCVSCKEMERFTFSDPAVRDRLAGALLLRADVTANNDDDRALLRRFKLFGPPGTIFFSPAGQEIGGTRVIGYQTTAQFIATLKSAGL